jgi:DNA-binding transcriptional ArsR family regulator
VATRLLDRVEGKGLHRGSFSAAGAGARRPRPRSALTYNHMVVDNSRDTEAEDLLFKALGDATRRDILVRSREAELSVSALTQLYPISFAAVQKHVALLERAGLVKKERRGREQVVHVEASALARARAILDRLERDWRGRVERIDRMLGENEPDSDTERKDHS